MRIMLCVMILSMVVWPRAGWSLDACDHDRPVVCNSVTPGHGAIHACMLANLSKLSPDCQNVVQKSEDLLQQFIGQCKDDARRYCAMQMDVRPDDVVACMRQHKEQFSAKCKRIHQQIKAYDYPILN
jgi:hypothetical protein